MRNKPTAAGFIALILLVSQLPAGPRKDAGEMIVHANSVIMTGSATHEAVEDALVEILDAALLVLPKAESNAECRSRIEVAKNEIGQKSFFSAKAHQYLALAYRLASSGKAWQVPAELRDEYREKDIMQEAREVGQRLIDSALADLKAGRGVEAVRSLLDYVLMVITPVER